MPIPDFLQFGILKPWFIMVGSFLVEHRDFAPSPERKFSNRRAPSRLFYRNAFSIAIDHSPGPNRNTAHHFNYNKKEYHVCCRLADVMVRPLTFLSLLLLDLLAFFFQEIPCLFEPVDLLFQNFRASAEKRNSLHFGNFLCVLPKHARTRTSGTFPELEVPWMM